MTCSIRASDIRNERRKDRHILKGRSDIYGGKAPSASSFFSLWLLIVSKRAPHRGRQQEHRSQDVSDAIFRSPILSPILRIFREDPQQVHRQFAEWQTRGRVPVSVDLGTVPTFTGMLSMRCSKGEMTLTLSDFNQNNVCSQNIVNSPPHFRLN